MHGKHDATWRAGSYFDMLAVPLRVSDRCVATSAFCAVGYSWVSLVLLWIDVDI